MHEIIETILRELTVNGEAVPVAPIRYRGKSLRFVTWQIILEDPETVADDHCIVSIVEVDVDIFSVDDYSDIMRAVYERFTSAGWVWAGTGPEMYEEETGLYHRTITFSRERMN